ncbi:MAG: SPOR domain-containing protein [Moraxellaceae bacterium]
MSAHRAPLFLVAGLGSLLMLCVFVLLLAVREKQGVVAPVLTEVGVPAAAIFPKDFGQLGDLVPFAGGVAPIAAQVVAIDQHAAEFRDAAWLQQQNAESFTIQVLAVRDEESVKRFLADRPDRERYTYFMSALDGSNWYVVTTGSYTSVELARGVAESGIFGTDSKPFPRRMGAYLPVAAEPAPPSAPAP